MRTWTSACLDGQSPIPKIPYMPFGAGRGWFCLLCLRNPGKGDLQNSDRKESPDLGMAQTWRKSPSKAMSWRSPAPIYHEDALSRDSSMQEVL